MKYAFFAATFLAAAPALATEIHPHPQTPRATSSSSSSGGTSNVRVNNNSTLENNDVLQVPGIVAPVPRGFVPVMSVYGQLDYQQRGTVGAQVSFPLAR